MSVYVSGASRFANERPCASARARAASVSAGTLPSAGSLTNHGRLLTASRYSYQCGGPAPVSFVALPPIEAAIA